MHRQEGIVAGHDGRAGRDRRRSDRAAPHGALLIASAPARLILIKELSERVFQIERHGQWTKGKSADTFGPIGPGLVTCDDVPDPQALSMWLDVNGTRRQNGSTATMVYGVRFWCPICRAS